MRRIKLGIVFQYHEWVVPGLLHLHRTSPTIKTHLSNWATGSHRTVSCIWASFLPYSSSSPHAECEHLSQGPQNGEWLLCLATFPSCCPRRYAAQSSECTIKPGSVCAWITGRFKQYGWIRTWYHLHVLVWGIYTSPLLNGVVFFKVNSKLFVSFSAL